MDFDEQTFTSTTVKDATTILATGVKISLNSRALVKRNQRVIVDVKVRSVATSSVYLVASSEWDTTVVGAVFENTSRDFS